MEDKKNYPTADSLLRQAIAVNRAAAVVPYLNLANWLTSLSRVLIEERKLPEAEAAAREALSYRLPRLPLGHWQTAQTERVLGKCLGREGKDAEADSLLRESYSFLQAAPDGRPAREREKVLGDLVELAQRRGHADEALKYRTLLAALKPAGR